MSEDAAYKDWLQRELLLAECEAAYLETGVHAALLDAIALCKDHPQLTPGWVLSAVLKDYLADPDEAPKTSGRTANKAAKHRHDLIHLNRWYCVKWVREMQARGGGDFGKTWPAAYEAAADMLRGLSAAGEAGSIKRSYQIVEPKNAAARFYLPCTQEGLVSVLGQQSDEQLRWYQKLLDGLNATPSRANK